AAPDRAGAHRRRHRGGVRRHRLRRRRREPVLPADRVAPPRACPRRGTAPRADDGRHPRHPGGAEPAPGRREAAGDPGQHAAAGRGAPEGGVRRRRRRSHGEVVSHERWLISYADFITLLFAFFVTMYAISTVDQRKLEKAVAAFQQAFAQAAPTDAGLQALLPEVHDVTEPTGALADVRERLARRLARLGEHRVELSVDHRGLVITVREAVSF